MKPTPFLKRVFASLVTVATATTLATAGLYQSAFAETTEIEVTGSGTDNAVTAVTIPSDTTGNYTVDATVNVTWNNSAGSSYWRGYAYGVNNTGSLGTLDGSISMTDTTAAASKLNTVNLYALNNSSGATIGSISGASISATNSVEPSTFGYAYGIFNSGTITAIENKTTITATSTKTAYGIYNNSSIGSISETTITATSTNSLAYGIYNNSSIGSISETTITATSTNSFAYGIYLNSENTSESVSISGSVTANAATTSVALFSMDQNISWNFVGDTTLTATGGSNNYAIRAYADLGNNNAITLTSLNADGTAANATVSMTGDISTPNSLTIASGNYVLEGDSTTITASSMSISSGASLTLNDATTFILGDGETVMNYGTINADATYLGSGSISNQDGSIFGITGGTIETALASVSASIQINDGAEVSSSADYINTELTNDGTLTLTDGTLGEAITGDGSIEIAADNSVSTDAAYLGTELTNNGTLELTGGTLSSDITMAEGASLSTTEAVTLTEGASVSSTSITLTGTGDGTTANITDWSGDSISNATISKASVTITSSSSDDSDTTTEASTQSAVSFSLTATRTGVEEEVTTEGASFTNVDFVDTTFTLEDNSTLTLTNVSLDADCSITVASGASASIDATNLTLTTSDISMSGNTITIDTFDVEGKLTVNVGGTFTVNLDMSDDELTAFQAILNEYGSTNFTFTGLATENVTDFELIISNDAAEIMYDYSCMGDMLNSSDGSGVNITISSSELIPEPSTATLSLLALAGLCIRRRRKA